MNGAGGNHGAACYHSAMGRTFRIDLNPRRDALAFLAGLLACLGSGPRAAANDLVGIYLTWPADPTTGIVVNWVNLYPRHTNTVWYRAEDAEENADAEDDDDDDEEWLSAEADHSQVEPSSLQLRRVALTGLDPDRTYAFGIGSKPGPGHRWRFRTMPARLERPVRFVAGGDMLHERDHLDRMNRQAAALDPDFALLGGDLAYDNGVTATSWIDWLGSWMSAGVAPRRRLIPIVAAIGNHEVRGGYRGDPAKDAPYYWAFFMRPGLSYSAADVGDYLSLVVLDTGHIAKVPGAQAEWLAGALAEREGRPFLFVSYHFPAYGTVKAPAGMLSLDHPKSVMIREHWVPHFERHGVTAVFEHDHHTHKRSHRIRAGERDDENGLLYLGDGAWGVPPRAVPAADKAWWLARAESRSHLWAIDVRPDGTSLARAIDDQGETFDEVEMPAARSRPLEAVAH